MILSIIQSVLLLLAVFWCFRQWRHYMNTMKLYGYATRSVFVTGAGHGICLAASVAATAGVLGTIVFRVVQ